MRKLCIFFGLLMLAPFLGAQDVYWDGSEDYVNIGKNISFLEDPAGTLSPKQVHAEPLRSEFENPNQLFPNFGFTSSHHWLRFTFNNPTEDDLYLEIANASLPVTNLYYQDSTGQWNEQVAGYQIPLDEKMVKHHFQLFPLPPGEHELYIKVLTHCHPLPIRIWEKEAFRNHANFQKISYGIYLGLMLFVILNNLFLFVTSRNWINLFYAFVVVIYMSYTVFVIDGFALFFFNDLDMMFWYFFIPEIGVIIQLIYCLYFLETPKYIPKWNKIAWGVITYFTLYFVFRILFMDRDQVLFIQGVNTLNALISFGMMGIIGVKVGNRGNKLGYYFAWAYLIYFLLVLAQAFYSLIGWPGYLFELSHVAIATLIEALVLSYLLSVRIEWEKRDIIRAREEAQREALEATRENERIVRLQNEILEVKVAERTKKLNASLRVIEREKQKSDELLLNILPFETAQELKEYGIAKARSYESVSVLFSDFKNFTQNSEHIPPEVLINTLNRYFVEFDKIMKKYNLEKIKTVGDAYMAAGGLPTPNNSHPVDTVKAALEIQELLRSWNQYQMSGKEMGWQARIGIHTGRVVSGVVGMHKFSYDIWGDTVNTAARMETHGMPGKVNISAVTYEMIKEAFVCVSRGEIDTKGKGRMEMFFVEGVLEYPA